MIFRSSYIAISAAALALATPAFAEEAAPAPASSIAINGTVSLVSQYRYRGISYTDEEMAVQSYITVSHASGLYVGTFGSNLAGYGTYGGANLEADIYGGYMKTVGKTTFDVGLWWYQFPGTDKTDFAEVYAAVTHPVGPGKVKLGFYYAPKQDAIGGKDDLSAYSDLSLPISSTPITLKAHAGYTTGKGSILAGPTGHYWDYMVGADYTWRNFTLNASYVDTTIDKDKADVFYYIGGHDIVDGAVVVSLTAAF